MNFVAQVEEHLRDLGAEARKKHPGVKEASERAILQLRTLQNSYVTAVRKASQTGGEHPTTALFQSQDLLRPFLLAANYPNASPKLIDISLKGMSLLIKGNAVCPGDGIHMVRVWTIQANVCASTLTPEKQKQTHQVASNSSWFGGILSSTTDVSSSSGQGTPQKKESAEKVAMELLRCLILLLQDESLPGTDEQWTASVALCCILGHVQVMVVQQAAKTSLHQVLSFLFHSATPHHTVETWRDLLILASREPTSLRGAFVQCKSSAPSPTLCLELLCRILRGNPDWFLENVYEIEIESLQVCKALVDDKNSLSFELVWRSYTFATDILNVSDSDEKELVVDKGVVDDDPESEALDITDSEEDEDLQEAEECRAQLITSLVQSIVRATEACRDNHDFEDGFIYSGETVSTSKNSKGKPIVTLIPDSLLWRAGLALETLYGIIDKNPHFVVVVAEAVSDFATIGTSCRDHMLQVVEYSQQSKKDGYDERMVPSLFRRAEEIQSAALASIKMSENPKNMPSTSCDVGQTLWTAFNVILELCRHVDDDVSFAPSLALMQHYLKRFPGSQIIMQSTLSGYDRLALIIDTGNSVQRQALLSSLCKLSLPAWGKHDVSTQLQDNHIEALLCLLGIVHRYRDRIMSEWYVVLWTLEELGSLSVGSQKLSDEGYSASLSVSAVYGRIAPLSAALSNESVKAMMEALVEVSKASIDRRLDVGGDFRGFGKEEPSIGGKLFSFAGSAMTGADRIAKNGKDGEASNTMRLQRLKTSFSSEYKQDFHRRLLTSRALRCEILAELPLSLMMMTDISLSNTYRFKTSGASISAAFCSLAASSKDTRAYAMDMLSLLISTHLSDKPIPAAFVGPTEVVSEEPPRSQLLQVVALVNEQDVREEMSQVELLSPLCDTIKSANQVGVAEAGMNSLHSFLEGSGHNLSGKVWTVVIEAVSSLSGDSSYKIDRTGLDWSSCCALAFRCLKLIVDDFLDELPLPTEDSSVAPRKALMECCSSFGSSRHDLNTSLTAIGLLWTIADQDADTSSIERALDKLVLLSADSRTEVRNCAVNTLFSCVVGRGQNFSVEQWERCIRGTVFGVYDQVLTRGGMSQEISSPDNQKYQTSVHHSRNSADKQWTTTEVLVLQGLNRVLRHHFSQLLETTDNVKLEVGKSSTQFGKPWLVDAWSRTLLLALNAAKQTGGRDTLDLRNSGVDLTILCLQLSCRAGIQAAITPARVGTNMEVVNGALRSVGESKFLKPQDTPSQKTSESVGAYRKDLFVMAFDNLSKLQIYLDQMVSDRSEIESSRFNIEPIQNQVLFRLIGGLAKLFECIKNDELRISLQRDSQRLRVRDHLACSEESIMDGDDYESKLVRLVVTVATKAINQQAHFCSQAQRGALDLLREMTDQGSNYSIKGLASLAGPAFFWVTDRETTAVEAIGATSDVLAREAATIVAEKVKIELIVDETRAEVLSLLLLVFTAECDNDSWKLGVSSPKQHIRKRSYKLFVPVMDTCLLGAQRLASSESPMVFELLDLLWGQVETALTQMLQPICIAGHARYISQASHIAELLKSTVAYAPAGRLNDIAALLSFGAVITIEIAREQIINSGDDEGIVRSEKRREEALKVFRECMNGLCKLQPESSMLRSISKQVFNEVLESFRESKDVQSLRDASAEIAILTCQAIKRARRVENLVISLFPQLCLIICVDHPSLGREVAALMETVNIAGAVEDATLRMEEAERRAESAEGLTRQLTAKIEVLSEEIARLHRDIAVFSASSALS